MYCPKVDKNKASVINDPLGQTHSHASSEQYLHRDFGLAEWINTTLISFGDLFSKNLANLK